LHTLPSTFGGLVHVPVVELQSPALWHWSLAWHTTALDAEHTPAWHASPSVHAFPSSHDVPFAFVGFEHRPVVASHVPAAWQSSDAVHVTGAPLAHVPA
jgi:hypothetical protein